MIQLFLKHVIYETAIEQMFKKLSDNFPDENKDPIHVTSFDPSFIGKPVVMLYHRQEDGRFSDLEVAPDEYSIQFDDIIDEYYLESSYGPEYDFYDMEEELVSKYKIYI
jgi:hypothetical protein